MATMSTTSAPWSGTGGLWYPGSSTYPDPYQLLSEITRLQDELRKARQGLTQSQFDNVHDADLVLELIARGYVVHKPLPEE